MKFSIIYPMISCYILGDNSTEHLLKDNIPSLFPISILGSSPDFRTALKQIIALKPDLVFVDSELVKTNHVETALLKQLTSVIFTSNLKQTASCVSSDKEQITSVIETSKVQKTLNEAYTYPRIFEETVFIKTNTKGLHGMMEVLIRFKDIIFIESVKNYLDIHLDGNKHYRTYMTLKNIEKDLSSQFIRINKSFIINMDKITAIEGSDFIILNYNEKARIPIGPTYKNSFTKWKNKKRLKFPESKDTCLLILTILNSLYLFN